VDLTESLQSITLTQLARRDLLAQQYLTLAAVYLPKVFNRDPEVLGVPLFDARSSLLPALRNSLEEFFSLTKDVYAPEHTNARLRALYVGAMAEQAYPTSGSDPHAQWFNTRLAEQAKKMGVQTWDQARDILRAFSYFVRIQPNGATWFERILEVFEENHGSGVQSP
jgi:hypothetical protein